MDFSQIDMGELGRQIFCKLLKATASEGSYQDILEQCREQDKPFEDEEFPANKSSLIGDWNDPDVMDKVATWKQFEWMRVGTIPSIVEGGVHLQVFYDSIDPSDIKQGLLGDCYFLSCLSVLAENPKRIRKLFVSDQVNKYGVYGARLCKNGEWKEVVIDDRFPVVSGEPAFSKAHGDELWVLILEKAWAKLFGSYERIEAGFAEHVLRDLTGAPCEVVHNDDEQLFDKLHGAEKKGFLIAASAGSTSASKDLLESLGLIGNHSYGVLDVREVQGSGETIRLVKLRNPWGDFEWMGDWSDDSDLWTPALKKQLGWTDVNDGTFWMSLTDFIHYFSRVQICRINDSFKYSSYKVSQPKDTYNLIRIVVQQDGDQTFTITQTDERCFTRDEQEDDYDYSNARLVLARIEGDDLVYMGGAQSFSRDTWKEFKNLRKGEYYAYIEMDWKQNHGVFEMTLSAYGASQVYFLRDESKENQSQDILQKIYTSCALQELEGCKHSTYEQYGCTEIHKYSQMCEEGIGYVLYHNKSDDSTLQETVTYTKFEGLQLGKPFKGSSFEVKVASSQFQIVLIKQVDPYGFTLSSSTTCQIQFSEAQLRKLAKEQGKMTRRNHPQTKKEMDIYQYQYKHSAGICYLYENETTNKTLEENLKFQLGGLEIADNPPGNSEVKFKIGPGQSKFIQLKSVAPQWKIQTAVAYGIY